MAVILCANVWKLHISTLRFSMIECFLSPECSFPRLDFVHISLHVKVSKNKDDIERKREIEIERERDRERASKRQTWLPADSFLVDLHI